MIYKINWNTAIIRWWCWWALTLFNNILFNRWQKCFVFLAKSIIIIDIITTIGIIIIIIFIIIIIITICITIIIFLV